jgi:hypothetical protein
VSTSKVDSYLAGTLNIANASDVRLSRRWKLLFDMWHGVAWAVLIAASRRTKLSLNSGQNGTLVIISSYSKTNLNIVLSSTPPWIRVAMGWTTESRSYESRRTVFFSTSSKSDVGLTQLTNWVQGVKRPGREGDHLPPTSANKMRIYISTSP